ncbi:glycosyltransferase family 9 protein [Desulfovibrio sp. OttesenSCG-928-A18]|nr:glycosyltransferase family 9 protein [Desulfovibrio sp. OttesenSCG-928-A18]
MDILLINLTRFGDLLQSQAAINDLRHCGFRVSLVCLDNFAEAAALLSGLEHVFALPGSFLLSGLDPDATHAARAAAALRPSSQAVDWRGSLARLTRWRQELFKRFRPDCVCNLTPSLSARLLALFLSSGGACEGFTVDEHGFGRNSSPWAGLMQNAGASRGISPFNLVDLFRRVAQIPSSACPAQKIAGAGDFAPSAIGDLSLKTPDQEASASMRRLLDARLRAEGGTAAQHGAKGGYLALQLGASEDRRRWPAAFFAELGDRLWQEEGICPVLLGSKGEQGLAERYAALAKHPHINLCGRTNLEELAAALLACRMLVSNDTGTMHYAAGLGIPVLAVFLATAQPFDTGPYQVGSCCLEPDLDCHPCAFGSACPHELRCRKSIAPALVAELVLARLRSGQWQEGDAMRGRGARIWLSVADDRGFMDLRSLSGHDTQQRSQWLGLQRRYLRCFLDRRRGEGFAPPAPSPFKAADLDPGPSAPLRSVLAEACALINLMIQQGRAASMSQAPMLRQRFLATWQKVDDTLGREPASAALAALWREETQAEGQDFPLVLAVAEEFRSLLSALLNNINQ